MGCVSFAMVPLIINTLFFGMNIAKCVVCLVIFCLLQKLCFSSNEDLKQVDLSLSFVIFRYLLCIIVGM